MKLKQIVCILIAILVVACSVPTPTPILSPIPPSISPLVSPLPANHAIPFEIDRPVAAGAEIVHGSGPAGVPIYIADVTFMGAVLGQGTVGSDGKFAVKVPPLEASHRIGLGLAELAGTQWKTEDFYPVEFFGPGAMQVPQVGFFHDTALVSAK